MKDLLIKLNSGYFIYKEKDDKFLQLVAFGAKDGT